MHKNVWTTPFGLTLLIGSALALIAGFAFGTNVISVEENGYNTALGMDNLSESSDENMLIEANREPLTEVPVRASEQPTSSPSIDEREKEVEVPVVTVPEPDVADEEPIDMPNESESD